jgi:hypothetical protein
MTSMIPIAATRLEVPAIRGIAIEHAGYTMEPMPKFQTFSPLSEFSTGTGVRRRVNVSKATLMHD